MEICKPPSRLGHAAVIQRLAPKNPPKTVDGSAIISVGYIQLQPRLAWQAEGPPEKKNQGHFLPLSFFSPKKVMPSK